MVLMALTVMIILNLIVTVKRHQTQDHSFKLRLPLARVNCFLHSFFVRIIKQRNAPPKEIMHENFVIFFSHFIIILKFCIVVYLFCILCRERPR